MPTITGTAGSDTLTGGSDADIINDELGGDDILRGMGGNDTLHFWRPERSPVSVLRAEGGDGNDLLDYYVFNASTAVLDGGAGSDVFRIWAVAGSVEIVTGSGADILDFSVLNPTWGGQMVVTDFTGGVGGDRIVWDSPTFKLTQLFTGWNGGNPFASGHLKLTQVGADTVLSIDLDGATGAQAGYTVLTFRSTLASSLTAWNFSGYDPNGGGIPGQTFMGTAGVDQLIGTNGEDIMSGLDGDDFLQGRNSNDRLDGGAGNDRLNGGMGDDIVDGGAGDDQLSDLGNPGEGGGNDILMGGDGNDTISVSRWGGSTDRVQLFGGDGADELSIIGDPGFSALLDGGAGNDRIYLQGFLYGDLTIATGAGGDTVYMGRLENPSPTIRFTDFTAGAGGDILSWEPMLTASLIQWNGYNPFQIGFARLVQEGGDVLLQVDRDASGNAHGWITLITFVSTVRTDFSAANFGYNPLVTPGQMFSGTSGNDVFNGTAGDDVMQSWNGDDVLNGGAGNDDLQGGAGNDILAGGEGDDRLDGGQGGDWPQSTYVNGQYVSGGDVADYRSATRGVTVDLRIFGPQDTGQGMDRLEWIDDLFGSAFDDVLTGTIVGPNLLMGFGGRDRLSGDNGNDTLVGGDGDDVLDGGFGDDILDGGDGLDVAVYGGSRSNYVIASGPNGVTTVTDTAAYNQVDTLRGVERLRFSDGLFDLNGAPVANVINGTSGADALVGTAGFDSIDGGVGDDVITGGQGNDTIAGGQGLDTAVFAGLSSAYTVSTTGGVTTVSGPDGVDTLTGIERLLFSNGLFDLLGNPVPNTINGTANGDTIAGTGGVDLIYAGGGDDIINAGGGADVIDAGSGADTVNGQDGDDTLIATSVTMGSPSPPQTTFDGGAGSDTFDFSRIGIGPVAFWSYDTGIAAISIANYRLTNVEILVGTSGLDIFSLGFLNAGVRIDAGDGNDLITTGSGADVIFGGAGDDEISSSGADTLDGGDGNDLIIMPYSGSGAATLIGGDGTDTLRSFASGTFVNFSTGEARIAFNPGLTISVAGFENGEFFGDTVAVGGAGRNVFWFHELSSNSGTLDFDGGAGDDVLSGWRLNDTLRGGDDNDLLTGGGGNDLLDGGNGIDTADYSGAAAGVTAQLNTGQASNDGDGGVDTFTSIENLTGSAFNDVLLGDGGSNVLRGGAGYDVLIGLAGNDVIHGGAGAANELYGGEGDDRYVVEAEDTIVEQAGEGVDLVETGLSRFRLSANVENLTYTGTAGFEGQGNAGDNVIRGTTGRDVLIGFGGNDILYGGAGTANELYGGAGDDYYVVEANDTVVEAENDGIDTVESRLDTFVLRVNIENLVYNGTGNFTGVGNASNNLIIGGAGNDRLVGGAGLDTLNGGDGRDMADYSSAAAGVTVRLDRNQASNDGDGASDVLNGIEDVRGSAFNDVIFGDAGANTLWGGTGYDVLAGFDGDDVIHGGTGAANELYGGAGNDRYVVEAEDTIVEQAGEGVDLVETGLARFRLSANVENLTYTGTTGFEGQGNAGDNVIRGTTARDVLIGFDGNDILYGGSGAANELYGGAGDDDYVVEAGDTIVEAENGGADSVEARLNVFYLGANIENLVFGGVGDFVGTGNSLNNLIIGGGGDDVLAGGGGSDQIQGGGGHDRLLLRGVQADYTITAEGAGWRIIDNTAGRDGSILATSIEVLEFGDRSTRDLTPPAAPADVGDKDQGALTQPVAPVADTAKAMDAGPQVLPGDDDFILVDGPEVLPHAPFDKADGAFPLVQPDDGRSGAWLLDVLMEDHAPALHEPDGHWIAIDNPTDTPFARDWLF